MVTGVVTGVVGVGPGVDGSLAHITYTARPLLETQARYTVNDDDDYDDGGGGGGGGDGDDGGGCGNNYYGNDNKNNNYDDDDTDVQY